LPFPGPRADEGGAEDSWKGEVGPEEDRSSPSAYPAETPREVDPFIDRLRRVEEARRALRHRRVKPRLRYGRLALLGFLALLIVGAGWTALSRLWSDPVRDPVPPREEEGPALSADRASPDVPQSDDLKNEDPDPDPDPETVEKTLRERQYEHSLRMGGVALELSRYDEASRHFADALNVRSDDAGAWTFFAEARAGLGDVSGAIQSLRRALERDPALESAKIRLSDLEKERTEAEKTKAAEGGNGKTGRKAPAGGKNSPSPGAKSAGAANKAKVPPIQRKNGAKAAAQGSRTAPAVDGKEPSPSREALFNSGVSLFREGKFSESFEDFQACLRSGGSETLPSVSLAADLCPGSFDLFGSVGPLWGGFDAGLFPPFVRSLAEAVRLNPADRDLYANLVLSGARSGIDRKRLQTLLEGVYSHAFAHR
jgi:tetratricopeptide (TPR) repeat protein